MTATQPFNLQPLSPFLVHLSHPTSAGVMLVKLEVLSRSKGTSGEVIKEAVKSLVSSVEARGSFQGLRLHKFWVSTGQQHPGEWTTWSSSEAISL